MNAVVNNLTKENPGIVGTLSGTLLRNVIAQHGVQEKFHALLSGFTKPVKPTRGRIGGIDMPLEGEVIDTPIRHIVTRPHDGFSVGFVAEYIEGTNGLLAYKGTLTRDELIAIQQAGYKVSVASQSWRDSSYVFITE